MTETPTCDGCAVLRSLLREYFASCDMVNSPEARAQGAINITGRSAAVDEMMRLHDALRAAVAKDAA